MNRAYDVIVVGLGIMGSATLATLAQRGKRVLGFERFDLGHDLGSSHGVTRIIRIGYFEGEAYVPMARRAAELWRALGERLGERILFDHGTLEMAPAGHELLRQSEEACRRHDLGYEVMDREGINRAFPGISLPQGYMGIRQSEGGFLASDRAVAGYQMLAIADGAEVRAREPMLGFEPLAGGGVRVRTPSCVIEAGAMVLATGPWIGEHVGELKPLAVPERQVLGWFQPGDPSAYVPERFPASILWTPFGHFFHLPIWGAPGFKIGLHRHKREQRAADELDRNAGPEDEALLRAGLAFAFPKANGAVLRLTTCIYTLTPDEHFILDHLPGYPEIVIASPCSGHGFKFGSVFGDVLADLATGKTPAFDLSMFRLARFGI